MKYDSEFTHQIPAADFESTEEVEAVNSGLGELLDDGYLTEAEAQAIDEAYHVFKTDPEDYRAIALWGKLLGSFPHHIHQEQYRAAEDGAPLDALFKGINCIWQTVSGLKADHPFRDVYNNRDAEEF